MMTGTPDRRFETAWALGRRLRAGELDARDLAEQTIARIQASQDPAIFTSTCFDRARREAEQSAARYRAGQPLGALDGIPVAWKDLVDIEGLPTTAGSAAYRNAPPAVADSPVVQHLAHAGMVTVGKLNLSEFAYSALGLNPHFGTPHNPCATDQPRVPGGSSSGSAVAVAAGLVPVSIGTDTGGSVRTPAAFNGLIGYKPSAGRFDTTRVFPLSPTLDTIGTFAHRIADCVLLDHALRGQPAVAADAEGSLPLSSLTLVVPDALVLDGVEPEVARNFQASLDRVAAAGVTVQRRAIPELAQVRELIARYGNIAAAHAYRFHRALLEGPRHAEVDVTVYRRIMAGKAISDAALQALEDGRRALQQTLWASLGDALLVMPTVPHVAPPIARVAGDPDLFAQVNLKTIGNTLLGNMLNACGLAVPNGLGQAGMPTSLLLNAAPGQEARLLRAGLALESAIAGD